MRPLRGIQSEEKLLAKWPFDKTDSVMFSKVPRDGFRLSLLLNFSRSTWIVLIRTEKEFVHLVSTFYRFGFFRAKIGFSFLKGKNINVELMQLMHDLHNVFPFGLRVETSAIKHCHAPCGCIGYSVFYFQHITGLNLVVENLVQEAYEKTVFAFSFVNIVFAVFDASHFESCKVLGLRDTAKRLQPSSSMLCCHFVLFVANVCGCFSEGFSTVRT